MFDVVYSNHPQKSSTSLLIFYKKIVSFDSKIGQLGLLQSNQKWLLFFCFKLKYTRGIWVKDVIIQVVRSGKKSLEMNGFHF